MAIQKLNGRAGFSINHPPVALIDNVGNYTTTTGDITAVNFYGNWDGVPNDRLIENLQTGILYGGIISKNVSNPSKFDITAGAGIIVTAGASLTAMPNPVVTNVTWPAQTAVTITNLASADETWISINSSGTVVQQTSAWTDTQYESQIPLGALVHPDRSTINIAKAYPHTSYGQASQVDPFIRAFGPLKLSGYDISANGANLQVNKSAGKSYAIGRNYPTDPNNPNIVTDTNALPVTTIYRWYRNGSGGFTTVVNSAIDPTKYDDGTGTLSAVAGGQYTVQRLFALPNQPSVMGVYYGRQLYNSIETAQANIQYETFSENDSTATQGIFLGYLIVRGNATALNSATEAKFIAAGLFRNTANIGGGGVSFSVLDDFGDVTITSAANNDLLRYNSGTSQWVNSTINSLNIATITGTETLTNKTFITPILGDATATSINALEIKGLNSGSSLGNIAIGPSSGAALTTGANDNISIGSAAGDAVTTGDRNISIGTNAIGAATTVTDCVGIGYQALLLNTANGSIAIGSNCLDALTTGTNNVAIGLDSASAINTGASNLAIGTNALKVATTVSDNVAIGYNALQAKTSSGNGNIAIGTSALYRATTCATSTAVGYQSQFGSTSVTAQANTSLGYNSLVNISSGSYNSSFGVNSLYSLTSGAQNTGCGTESLYAITTTSNNTAVGQLALRYTTTGAQNTAIGYLAGAYKTSSNTNHTTSGDWNVYIGGEARASGDNRTNEVVLGGNKPLGLGSNTTTIGNTSTTANRVYGVASTGQVAPTLGSAAGIDPTTSIVFISGTTTIHTITAPTLISTTGGQITLIPTGLWSTGTSGNIALASTAVVSKALIMTYDATTAKWYPSY